jgi:hypothetical protein
MALTQLPPAFSDGTREQICVSAVGNMTFSVFVERLRTKV